MYKDSFFIALCLTVLTSGGALLNAAEDGAKLPSQWRAVPFPDLADREDFNSAPAYARRVALRQVSEDYRNHTAQQQLNFIYNRAAKSAAASKRETRKFVVWEKETCKACDDFYSEGSRIKSIRYGPLFAAVTLRLDDGKFVPWVYFQIDEEFKGKVDINPDAVQLFILQPEFGYAERLDTEEMAASMVRKARGWGAVIAGLSAMGTRSTTTSETGDLSVNGSAGTYRGSYSGYSTRTEPDRDTAERGRQTAERMVGTAQEKAEAVLSAGLRRTSLFAGQKLSGELYFKKKGKPKVVVLRVQVGRMDFEFPFESSEK